MPKAFAVILPILSIIIVTVSIALMQDNPKPSGARNTRWFLLGLGILVVSVVLGVFVSR